MHDKTPGFLEKHGVIEAKNEGKWYVGNVDTNDEWVRRILPETGFVDPIALIALKKDYIEDNQIPKYYYEATYWGDAVTNVYSWGPKKHGQASVLINVDVLKKFIESNLINPLEIAQSKNSSTHIVSTMFDEVKSCIKINNIEVPIQQDTDQYELCKAILKNDKSKSKLWEHEDMLVSWGEKELSSSKKSQMKVYRAAREINNKVERDAHVMDFLIYTTKTVQLNPNFL